MKKKEKASSIKVAFNVFLICLVFIVIIVYTSFSGISSLMSANESFNSFYANQFLSVKNLNRIAKDLLQIRINMLQELSAARGGDLAGVRERQESSKRLFEDYNRAWDEFQAVNLTSDGKALAAEWLRKNKNPVLAREQFHRATLAGDIGKGRELLDQWMAGYKELRDTTYQLIGLQEKVGNEIRDRMSHDARNSIFGSYILLSVSLLIGFVITILLARFFISSTTDDIRF